MTPVSTICGTAIPWGRANVDTDVIIPARWLKTVGRQGLGVGAFETVRAAPDNIFDAHGGAAILIAGDNFGCGSSREHAAWAMLDLGLRAVIAPSFSDIFAGNAFKNGLLSVVLPQAAIDRLMAVSGEGQPLTIDLENQVVTTPYQDRFAFEIDPFRKMCLVEGLDEVALTLAQDDRIARYESARAEAQPWLVPGTLAELRTVGN